MPIHDHNQAAESSFQPSLLDAFDRAASIAARDAGMAKAAENKASLLKFARELAVKLAANGREISADDVQFALVRQGISIAALGNAAGSLFTGKQWEWTGRRVKSIRSHAHANELKVWRLRTSAADVELAR